jgi:ribosomal-protein-alanine N-acetyltransferase
MSPSDCDVAQKILQQCPEASMWSIESLLETASKGNVWTAQADGRVAGILIGRTAADEFEILNLAVGIGCRRRGIATQLVVAALEQAHSAGARQAYLEVRASNRNAISLYSKLGFSVTGRRANYYRDPSDDALLLSVQIPESNR